MAEKIDHIDRAILRSLQRDASVSQRDLADAVGARIDGWLIVTSLLGGLFVAGQVYEFTVFFSEGLGYTESTFSSAFFTLTGFHGAHVTIGIIMLIGIAAKNGVLIVEFINQLRDAGRDFETAITEAAGIRLRPVIMTTIATVMGSLPLMLATGAGSSGRNMLGIVIFSGVSLATLLTLFIVPALYALFARNTSSPQKVSRLIDQMQRAARDDEESSLV